MQIELAMGLLVMVTALVTGIALAVITARSARGGSLIEVMVQTSFLPEKRRRYLAFLSVEGSMILITAILWGLAQVGIVGNDLASVLTGASLLVAIAAVGAVSWLGLRPSRLSAEERRSLAAMGPAIFQSLFFAPLAQAEESPTG